jgi:hypothetical protein
MMTRIVARTQRNARAVARYGCTGVKLGEGH